MLRIASISLALILLLAGVMFWSGGAAQKKADFTFINRGEVGVLDPNRLSWMQDIRIGYALWEGLYALDPVTLEAMPGTANPIDINPERTVYTFHIRPDAFWSNGDPVQAKDFIFSWRRNLEEPGEYTYLLHYIRGAEEYEKAYGEEKPADFSTVGIEELNPKTLRVTLIHPVAFFPDVCAFPCSFPLNERSMDRFLDKDMFKKTNGRKRVYDKEFTRPPDVVTNGAYKLTSWQFRRRMRLEANEFYWDKANVKSKIIDTVSADDIQWGYAMYDSGGVDWVADFTGDVAAELFAQHRKDFHVFPAFGTYFYSFNCNEKLNDGKPNPFADARVRQALCMVVDRQLIVDRITRLGEIPSNTYIPRGAFPHYTSPAGLPYDIEKARKLLADAGYPGGKGFPPVSLLFNNEANHGAIAQNVSRQWFEKLGLDIRLEGIEIKIFQGRLHNKDYAVARAGWFGDYNDASTFTDKYKPDSGNNDSNWINAEYDRLCKLADVEPDADKRLAYFSKAEDILLNEAPILPVYTYVNSFLFRDNVKGLPLNNRDMQMFKSIEVKH